ncbi:hypothetical protein ACJX0J_016348 [Zea mays]
MLNMDKASAATAYLFIVFSYDTTSCITSIFSIWLYKEFQIEQEIVVGVGWDVVTKFLRGDESYHTWDKGTVGLKTATWCFGNCRDTTQVPQSSPAKNKNKIGKPLIIPKEGFEKEIKIRIEI